GISMHNQVNDARLQCRETHGVGSRGIRSRGEHGRWKKKSIAQWDYEHTCEASKHV
ncbi:hypothetical protein SK128_021958, partial [Halocaridina rubra]